MTPIDSIKTIQRVLLVDDDGAFGPKSRAALEALIKQAEGTTGQPAPGNGVPDSFVHSVKASSFADPADVAAFRKCKKQGGTDQECFRVGDNGVGKWGDDCTGPAPMCALPPEDWQQFGANARGKKVLVTANGQSVVCELRDTMPRKANITNGAGIDLNEAAVHALGLEVPLMHGATWQWA